MAKIDPEKLPAEEWVPVTKEMLLEMYKQKQAKRKKVQTFMGGYGMVVTTKKKKRA